jgi:L-seryl-tRNA(Ser) seleniumtransferase
MVEVGTTNKTHLRDYERALTPDTAALLRVHPSNYRIVGFTADVALADLVALRQKQDLLVIDDLGCGVLVNLEQFGLPHEPTVQESISAGADLALFSGDKLIGGPQAGIIVGRKVLIDRIKKHPLTRMLRVGKMTDMVLEQTLRLFLDPATLIGRNPTLRMLTAPADGLRRRARSMKHKLEKGAPALCVDVVQGESQVGGGSLPATPIPTWLLAVKADSGAGALCARLRRHEPPVIARIEDDRVMLDVRTLLDGEETEVVRALAEAVSGGRA